MAEGDDNSVVARIRLLAAEQLRDGFPFVKMAAVEKLLDQLASTTESLILELKPEIEAAKKRISFFSLSPELRNAIYELALVNKAGISIFKYGQSVTKRPALLGVNRQVRRETVSIYYGMNTFFLLGGNANNRVSATSAIAIKLWLTPLSPDVRAHLTGIELIIYDGSSPADALTEILDSIRIERSRRKYLLKEAKPIGGTLHEEVLRVLHFAGSGMPAESIKLKWRKRGPDLYEAVGVANKDKIYNTDELRALRGEVIEVRKEQQKTQGA